MAIGFCEPKRKYWAKVDGGQGRCNRRSAPSMTSRGITFLRRALRRLETDRVVSTCSPACCQLADDSSGIMVHKWNFVGSFIGFRADIDRFDGHSLALSQMTQAVAHMKIISNFDNGVAVSAQDPGNFLEFEAGIGQMMHDPNHGQQIDAAVMVLQIIGLQQFDA